MEDRAARRIKGKGPAPVVKRSRPEDGRGLLLPAVVISLFVHLGLLLAVYFYRPPQLKPIPVELVQITAAPQMPAGPQGGGGESPKLEEPKAEKEKPPEETVVPSPKQVEKKKQEPEKPKPPLPEVPKVTPPMPKGPGQGPVGGGTAKQPVESPIAVEGGINIPELGPYLKKLQDRIYLLWRVPSVNNRTAKVIIHFKIFRNGRLADIEVRQSSGMVYYDNSALSAVRDLKVMPPLPQKFPGDALGINYTFVPEQTK
jgi:TonB family protein